MSQQGQQAIGRLILTVGAIAIANIALSLGRAAIGF